MLTADVRPGQLEVVSNEIAQEESRLDGALDAPPVDGDRDGMHREIVRPGTRLREGIIALGPTR